MDIPFTKASACGNDFLIIDGTLAPDRLHEVTRQICDRHDGVGADGVEWLFTDSDADVEARLINADGSDAEISGNGTRCVAAYLSAESKKESVTIRTGAGVKKCTLVSRSGNTSEFEAAMGAPRVEAEISIATSFGEVRGIPVSMGNPHFVVLVEKFWSDWQARAAEMQRSTIFKQGINIELVHVQDKSNIDVRFFERGVGETQSSGTGSSAAAVASIASRRAQSPVIVHAPGGSQTVRFEQEVFLRGPATLICEGRFFV
ncbi:MAG TPA: diaminopimelate epimerase [Terriglobales bacterium]|nr:diaminopimelate epimerase [Terriglobales bacterium]